MDNQQKTPEVNQNQKVVEKYYIEVNPSGFKKFWLGMLGGIGWGIGVTLGTAALIILIGVVVSRIDWVPIVGNFLNSVIESATKNNLPR